MVPPLLSSSFLPHEFVESDDEDFDENSSYKLATTSNSSECHCYSHLLHQVSCLNTLSISPQRRHEGNGTMDNEGRKGEKVKCLFPNGTVSLSGSAEDDREEYGPIRKVILPLGHNQKDELSKCHQVNLPLRKCKGTASLSENYPQKRRTLIQDMSYHSLFSSESTHCLCSWDRNTSKMEEHSSFTRSCSSSTKRESNVCDSESCYMQHKHRENCRLINFESKKDYNKDAKERMKLGKGGGYGRTTVFGRGNLWMILAILVSLSLLGPVNSLSILDDDDDEDLGGLSPFSHYQRSRRSAENFSTLHDALSLIPSNYSIHEPPPTNNSEATQVDFSVLIMNVRDIKELNEGYGDLELSLEMNLRIYWKDTRLSHLADRSGNKFIVLNPVLLDKIWHPDIFIDHVKGVAQPALISKPASLRVYPDSIVRYSARITVTMACQMDFHYYPADTQRCNVDMKSYAYSSKILALDWREGKGALLVEYLELPNFDVALDTTQNFMVNTSSGSYAGIRFTILLRRKLSYHLIQTYLPSTLFIIVSWLSFLVPPESVPGRMALCMTTLLTLTAMFSAVRQNTPNVSYVKALDIWMVVCIIFVFLTLVEYTVLLKLKSKKPKPKPPPPQTELVTSPPSQPQQMVTRWTIPSFQYATDTNNFKFRGCKTTDGVLNDNGSNGEMRHRENGEPVSGAGDNGNNLPATPQLPPPPPPPPPPTAAAPSPPGEKQLNKYELAAKKIERFTSAVIPTLFVIFNFIYWPWLIESADYYHHEKSTTIFKSM